MKEKVLFIYIETEIYTCAGGHMANTHNYQQHLK